ncbi:MAG: TRCF domain-containing protein, partial [Armatimonadota bacterium]
LYQLRGRVGRSQRQAYAYLLYKSDMVLTEIAERRLAAIREFADLGSGFKIAMRDLEIRGAGNILGAEQHGQMLSVGFDMYCHLLAQAVKELKGEQLTEEQMLPGVEVPVEAYLPNDYVPNESARLAIYRKMAAQVTEKDVSKIEEELDDRFGPPPAEVRNALAILRLRIQAADLGIKSVKEENGRIVILFAPGYGIHPESMRPLQKAFPEHNFEIKGVSLFVGRNNPIELISEFFRFIERSIQKSKPSGSPPPSSTTRPTRPSPQTTNVVKAGHRR